MIATGFSWFVGTYAASSDPTIGRLAHGFQGWYLAFLAWLVLAYPTGRLHSTATRVVIGLFLSLVAVRSIVRLATHHLSTEYDLTDPAAVDRFVADQTFRDMAESLFRVGVAAIAIAVIVLAIARLRAESDLGRRVAWPILLGGIAFAGAIVIDFITAASASSFAERRVAWDLGTILFGVTGILVPIGFLLGLTRSRLARGAVADLVVTLGDAPAGSQVRDIVARSLRDPSLELVYPTADGDVYLDRNGDTITLPTEGGRRAVTRLDVGGRTIAALIHDAALVEQPELVRSVAAAAALALENERLAADVRAQLEEVRRSRARIVAAGDAERKRIERDIHDGAQQRLVTVALMLQMARNHAVGDDPDLDAALAAASAELEAALSELRQLARGLHPAVLTEEGLAAAVDALADRTPIPVTLHATDRRFGPEVEATAYFVVAEALTNVVKHANATTAKVELVDRENTLVVEIADDGVGGAEGSPGSGLAGLEDRVAAVGGTLAIRSRPGEGTTIVARIPCA